MHYELGPYLEHLFLCRSRNFGRLSIIKNIFCLSFSFMNFMGRSWYNFSIHASKSINFHRYVCFSYSIVILKSYKTCFWDISMSVFYYSLVGLLRFRLADCFCLFTHLARACLAGGEFFFFLFFSFAKPSSWSVVVTVQC